MATATLTSTSPQSFGIFVIPGRLKYFNFRWAAHSCLSRNVSVSYRIIGETSDVGGGSVTVTPGYSSGSGWVYDGTPAICAHTLTLRLSSVPCTLVVPFTIDIVFCLEGGVNGTGDPVQLLA